LKACPDSGYVESFRPGRYSTSIRTSLGNVYIYGEYAQNATRDKKSSKVECLTPEDSFLSFFGYTLLPWKIVKLLFLGKMKNNDSPFNRVPKKKIKVIKFFFLLKTRIITAKWF